MYIQIDKYICLCTSKGNESVSKYELIFDEYITFLCFFTPLKEPFIIFLSFE